LTCRRRPLERTVGLHFGSQVEDVLFANRLGRRDLGSRIRVETRQIGECGLSSKRLMRAPGCSTSSEISKLGFGFMAARIAERVFHVEFRIAEAGRGLRRKAYPKKLRDCGGNAIVCSAPPSAGMSASFRKLWPSSLASTSAIDGAAPNMFAMEASGSLITYVTARIVWGKETRIESRLAGLPRLSAAASS
jgi:hypothetical protein